MAGGLADCMHAGCGVPHRGIHSTEGCDSSGSMISNHLRRLQARGLKSIQPLVLSLLLIPIFTQIAKTRLLRCSLLRICTSVSHADPYCSSVLPLFIPSCRVLGSLLQPTNPVELQRFNMNADSAIPLIKCKQFLNGRLTYNSTATDCLKYRCGVSLCWILLLEQSWVR